MYGARVSHRLKNAIPSEIGAEATVKLYRSPAFSAIAEEVAQARRAILKSAKANRQGGLKNDFGKSMNTRSKQSTQLLSHLIQGVEAKALKACLDHEPNSIVLLQHDGFTARHRVDVQAMERAMFMATGFNLKLEEEVVHPNLRSLEAWNANLSFPNLRSED